MTSISKNVYIDKLEDIVNRHNNTYPSLLKPTLAWLEGLSNQELSPSVSTRRACRSNATTFAKNKC